MGIPYEKPVVEYIAMGEQDVITASSAGGITKNPGHACTIMPNGKPIPENAVGHLYDDP